MVSKTILSVGISQDVFRFVADQTELVEVENGAFKRVQVKTITKLTTATAMQVRCVKYVNSGRVDVIAVYFIPKKICAFVPYNNEKMISLAITTAKNNQRSKRQWFYQYERFPEFS